MAVRSLLFGRGQQRLETIRQISIWNFTSFICIFLFLWTAHIGLLDSLGISEVASQIWNFALEISGLVSRRENYDILPSELSAVVSEFQHITEPDDDSKEFKPLQHGWKCYLSITSAEYPSLAKNMQLQLEKDFSRTLFKTGDKSAKGDAKIHEQESECTYNLDIVSSSDGTIKPKLSLASSSLEGILSVTRQQATDDEAKLVRIVSDGLGKTWFRQLSAERLGQMWSRDSYLSLQLLFVNETLSTMGSSNSVDSGTMGSSNGGWGFSTTDSSNRKNNIPSDIRSGFQKAVLHSFETIALEPLNQIFDFEVDIQTVPNGGQLTTGTTITEADIKQRFLAESNDWTSDIIMRGVSKLPMLKRFATFAKESYIHLQSKPGSSKEQADAFSLSNYGIVSFVDKESLKDDLGNENAAKVVASWIGYLRQCLSLEEEESDEEDLEEKDRKKKIIITTEDSSSLMTSMTSSRSNKNLSFMTKWEFMILAKAYYRIFSTEIIKRLKNLNQVLSESLWSQVELPVDVGRQIKLAIKKLREVTAKENSIVSTLKAARQSLFLMQEAAQHEALLSNLYFPLDFKAAVYLPILLPTVFPLIQFMRS